MIKDNLGVIETEENGQGIVFEIKVNEQRFFFIQSIESRENSMIPGLCPGKHMIFSSEFVGNNALSCSRSKR